MKVLVNQPRLTPELAVTSGVQVTDLIRCWSGPISSALHVPFNPGTKGLIGGDQLANMKETAFLINAGHTDLVDEEALCDALDKGYIAGASLSKLPDKIAGFQSGVRDDTQSMSRCSSVASHYIHNRTAAAETLSYRSPNR